MNHRRDYIAIVDIGVSSRTALLLGALSPVKHIALVDIHSFNDTDKIVDSIKQISELNRFIPQYDKTNTDKEDKVLRLKELAKKSLSFQPNRFLNKELHKYQFKTRV